MNLTKVFFQLKDYVSSAGHVLLSLYKHSQLVSILQGITLFLRVVIVKYPIFIHINLINLT